MKSLIPYEKEMKVLFFFLVDMHPCAFLTPLLLQYYYYLCTCPNLNLRLRHSKPFTHPTLVNRLTQVAWDESPLMLKKYCPFSVLLLRGCYPICPSCTTKSQASRKKKTKRGNNLFLIAIIIIIINISIFVFSDMRINQFPRFNY